MSGPPEIFPLPGYRVELSPERVEPSEPLPRDVPFDLSHVLPAPLVYLTCNDALWLRAYNSLTGAELEVRGRLLLPNGELFVFQQKVAPTSDRGANDVSLDFGLPRDIAGYFLLNLAVVRSAGVMRRGHCFVQLAIFRGSDVSGFRHQILAAGYVALDLALSWPGSGIRSPLEGPGALRSVLGTDPAAGVEISETVPAHARWRLWAMRAVLVTGPTAGNRSARFYLDDGATTLLSFPAQTNHPASLSYNYDIAAYGFQPAFNAGEVSISIPSGLLVFGGWRLRTSTAGLLAEDNWGAPQLMVEEWIEN
jgi:hypothetical protein